MREIFNNKRIAAIILLELFGLAFGSIPYFVRPCRRDDPDINLCFAEAGNHLISLLKEGIPELGYEGGSEPVILDEINLALGNGPDGYRATFWDVEGRGLSNMTLTAVRSDVESLQFQLSFFIPRVTTRGRYKSSGVLIMIKASGGGDYWGEYEGIRSKIYFRLKKNPVGRFHLLSVEDLKMDFSVKDMKMGIENLHNGNAVIEAALNLFINTHGHELLKEMKPSIKATLMMKVAQFMENLFNRVPYEYWLRD